MHEIKWSNLDLSNEQAESIVDEFNLMGMKRIDGDVLGSREITVTPSLPLWRWSFTEMVDTGRGSELGGIAHELNFRAMLNLRCVLNQRRALFTWSQEERQFEYKGDNFS